ncbi:DNA-primase RepB domain-containing protein [Ramlibacter sp. H39-3-26]|uniref:DNA-primase RepB domain-containing protein n=1 Tax=Curvibacter soli TaxID=3031331 RepID=UPI0023D9FD56|nr:DNA-primase RepB domain-containing protein [Ramlibacter sp. H39-3-26]MDF1484721.1 DNA-primase RepB domain-containing protein [Ramlibacter sp. H39-3-26]
MKRLQFNLEDARAFLAALDPDGVYTFQTFHDLEKRGGGVVLHGTLAEHQSDLMHLNQQGQGVFVMVNKGDGLVHGNAKTCRTTANVIAVRALFADLDGAPLEPILPHRPHIVVESSPSRWHAYWLARDLPLTDFKPLQQQLAQKFDADPKVCDLPRVMRLPGFWHQKGAPFQTRIHKLLSKENTHA